MNKPARIPSALGQASAHGQAGMTLLEIMISLTLGLILLTGIGTIYVGSNQTYRVQEASARLQETGRYAIEIIGRSMRQAGYANMPLAKIAPASAFGGTPINGADNACPVTVPVIDMVTVQYDGIAAEQDCQGTNIAAGQIVENTFFVESNALRCDARLSAAAQTPPAASAICPNAAAANGEELVQNVEDLQIVYGIDTDNDQSANSYTATPGNWSQVVSARVCVQARSEDQGITVGNQRFLNCAGALGSAATAATAYTTAADTRLRRTFIATFNLRNRIKRVP